jgi:hypothetical protein
MNKELITKLIELVEKYPEARLMNYIGNASVHPDWDMAYIKLNDVRYSEITMDSEGFVYEKQDINEYILHDCLEVNSIDELEWTPVILLVGGNN